jgi:hypothetical protein
MSIQEPTANAMTVEVQPEQAQHEEQKKVLRLRGGGNTCVDCLA